MDAGEKETLNNVIREVNAINATLTQWTTAYVVDIQRPWWAPWRRVPLLRHHERPALPTLPHDPFVPQGGSQPVAEPQTAPERAVPRPVIVKRPRRTP